MQTWRSIPKTVVWGAVMMALASCIGPDATTGVKVPAGTARFALRANITAPAATQVFLAAFYVKNGKLTGIDSTGDLDSLDINNDIGVLGAQIVDLKQAAGDQSIPLSVNVGPCLADASVAKTNGGCPVFIFAELLKGQNTLPANPVDFDPGDNALDDDAIGPVFVAPGSTVSMPRALELHQISNILVQPSALAVQIGQSTVLQATAFDNTGTPVANPGFTFTSASPSIATVNAGGVVTGVAIGSTTVTVTGGGRSIAVPVQVTAAPNLVLPSDTTAQFTIKPGGAGSGQVSIPIVSSLASSGVQAALQAPSIAFLGAATGWLSVQLSSPTTPASLNMVVTSSAASLSPGSYVAAVTVKSTNPSVAARTVVAVLTVSSTASVSGATSITFNGSNFSPNCTWTFATTSQLQMTVTPSADGSVSGTVQLSGNTTFTPATSGTGCNDGGGAYSVSLPVTGTASHLTFTGAIVSWLTATFSGSLSNGAVTGTLTLSFTEPPASSGSGSALVTMK